MSEKSAVQVDVDITDWKNSDARDRNDKRQDKFAEDEIDRIVDELGLPDSISKMAKNIYQSAEENDVIFGWSVEQIVAAAIAIACKQTGEPVTLDEIAENSRKSKKQIARASRDLADDLGIVFEPESPSKYVSKHAEELNKEFGDSYKREISANDIERAKEIIETAEEHNLISGKSPSGVAGAALYIVSKKLGVTQSQIADVARVNELTIRNRYKEQSEVIEQ